MSEHLFQMSGQAWVLHNISGRSQCKLGFRDVGWFGLVRTWWLEIRFVGIEVESSGYSSMQRDSYNNGHQYISQMVKFYLRLEISDPTHRQIHVKIACLWVVASEVTTTTKQPRRSNLPPEWKSVTSNTYVALSFWPLITASTTLWRPSKGGTLQQQQHVVESK